jgi:hypothetical protein
MCRSCLRTGVGHVPGLNNKAGHDSGETGASQLESALAVAGIDKLALAIQDKQLCVEGLKNGSYRAVTVMEPFISLSLKEAPTSSRPAYRGGEVVAPDLSDEQRKAFYDAENQAVDLINADFYKYAHHVTAHAKGALQPHELLRAFIRYKHVDYYDLTLFGRTYDWMKARGLTEGQSEHARLVVG